MDPREEGPNSLGDGYYDNDDDNQNDNYGPGAGQGNNNEEFDINFDEVNEDDEVELLYAKLRASKKARLRADEDAKLLENRIKLLKQEEAKARKKINETKKRAKDIIDTKKRNIDKQKIKRDHMKRQEQEENKRAVKNENLRNEIKQRISSTNNEILSKRKEEAERLRQEKREQEEMLEMYKQQEKSRATSVKLMVKNREMEAEEKRKRDLAEKRAIARNNLDEKVLRENQLRMTHEQQVAKMEEEELELIKRLQNTQCIQKAAYEDLEQALAGKEIDLEKLEAMTHSGEKKTKAKKKRTTK